MTNPILNWRKVAVTAGDGDIVIQLTGNADTELSTRYFWMPSAEGQVELQTDRRDGEPLTVSMSALTGQLDKLGFVFNAAPLVAGRLDLVATVRIVQLNSPQVLLEELIQLSLSAAGKFIQYADGVQFVRS